MGKRKPKRKAEAPRALVAPTPLPPELAEAAGENVAQAKAETSKPKYSFPTAGIRCPRCLSMDTIRVSHSADGQIQYRRCRRGHCRYSFKVVGTLIA